jgi:hypothetical protein
MVKESVDYKNNRITKLDRLLDDLIVALTEQKEYIERHTTAMEKLAQAIKQLESTIKREIGLESQKSSLLIEDLVKIFVEYEINPRYYQQLHRTMLKAATDSKHTELTRRKLTGPPKKEDK